ncbi:hypothetical protein PHAVU_002G059600 [Phaseolus vulgaris]|uniref:Peroxidase n=1 Tax=Phaseolus vulgaris TaxID=3885 RepID=V7CIX8_PHAVU|nr:hypothetical protein PHAVU_002G059600g [Phaseolus vulgaris]ESW29308.1 hypothetical protein PHAVU_002G059600g [Phaseolus vulgaris]
MSRIFLTTLSLLLLLLAPYAAGEGLKYKNSEFHNLFPFLGRDEDSNTEITGDTPEDRKEFNDRLPYSMPKNAVQSTSKLGQGFYDQSCPDVENIISKAFAQILKDNPGAIAHVIRLQFHDCFVNGCDASILLDFTPSGDNVEKSSSFNGLLLKGADLMDDIKGKVEEKCPGIVSCADVMTFSTYEAMAMAGLPRKRAVAGRKDSIISLASIAESNNLPLPDWTIDQMMELFGRKGFNIEEMVVLLGAHSLGKAHCDFFMQRAFNFNGTGKPDPLLPKDVVDEFQKACPNGGTALFRNPPVAFDSTPTVLDNLFYQEMIQKNRTLLPSDSHLHEDPRTKPTVEQMANDHALFNKRFHDVMYKLTSLNVLTGTEGEVRKICRSTN